VRGQPRNDPFLKPGIIGKDRRIRFFEHRQHFLRQGAARVAGALSEELPMPDGAGPIHMMDRPLEGNLLIGRRAFIERNRRGDRLKVQIERGRTVVCERLAKIR